MIESFIEHAKSEPAASDVRLAFLTAQQSLRVLQSLSQNALHKAVFRFVDQPGATTIDGVLVLLEREVATLKAMRENYKASRSGIYEVI